MLEKIACQSGQILELCSLGPGQGRRNKERPHHLGLQQAAGDHVMFRRCHQAGATLSSSLLAVAQNPHWVAQKSRAVARPPTRTSEAA
eukprot:354265-Chlamydomonas_euryale.AAC.5